MVDLTLEGLRAAIRSVIEHSSYTNALPFWFEPEALDFAELASAIQARAKRLKGEPATAFQILLPRNGGKRQIWALPSLIDQMLLQASVLSIAKAMDKAIDRRRVFSFRLRNDTGLGLVEDQASAWHFFEAASRERSACASCVLTIDLADAFASIDRARLKEFLRSYGAGDEADFIDVLLTGFGGRSPGLPLVNDSTFFLGSAYLSVVDQVVGKHAPDFVRYMDDYKIFGGTQGALEKVHQAISADLRRIGFTINPRKTWLGTTEDYVDFLNRVKVKGRPKGYLSALPSNIFDADVLVAQLALTLSDPDKYLTDGVGRMQMASLRKLRIDSGSGAGTKAAHAEFRRVLSAKADVVRKGLELLARYQRSEGEDWRAVWILYLLRDVDAPSLSGPLREQFQKSLMSTAESARSPLVRLWALPAPESVPVGKESVALFDSEYVQAGKRYYRGVQ